MKIGISKLWSTYQPKLFPAFDSETCETSEGHRRLILVLDNLDQVTRDILPKVGNCRRGRNKIDRFSFAAAFIAMKILKISTVKGLLERLTIDPVFRRICRFSQVKRLPCEATFSNAFNEFSAVCFAEKIHEEYIKTTLGNDLAHNVSRDSTAISAREKPRPRKKKHATKHSRKRGRPRKGEVPDVKEPTRIEKQLEMGSLEEMIKDLPCYCDKGGKKNAKGDTEYWQGYKLHIDTIDGDIPVSAVLTAASVHDSQVSIPLEKMTAERVKSLYSLMDAAYDDKTIKKYIESLGKVPVIDQNPRRGEKVPFDPPKKERYKARSAAERVNSQLKDSFGGRDIRVRGPKKVMSHLMFGVVSIAAEQLLKNFANSL